NAAIDRHPRDRVRMAVREDGKDAVTHYRLRERFRNHTALECRLETGRTHQIRVHMAHLKHPIVGDPLYGGSFKLPKAASDDFIAALRAWLDADWPAPPGVRALTTTRHGLGISQPPFDRFNLGSRCGDEVDAVAENRRQLHAALRLPSPPRWLRQVHGIAVARFETP
ncbi:MAG: laccase domain-containing protein, partial [Comamonas sp.]